MSDWNRACEAGGRMATEWKKFSTLTANWPASLAPSLAFEEADMIGGIRRSWPGNVDTADCPRLVNRVPKLSLDWESAYKDDLQANAHLVKKKNPEGH